MKSSNILPALAIIFFAVVLRLLPHPANVAPIAAMALFGGVYLSRRYALVLPLLAMFVSDLFLGFHNTMIFVYGSFLLTGVIGIWLKERKSFKNILLASFGSSLLFFLITNFGVWFTGTMYAKTVGGFIETYVMALPFFRNTIVGDLLYTGLFFGSYELAKTFLYSRAHARTK